MRESLNPNSSVKHIKPSHLAICLATLMGASTSVFATTSNTESTALPVITVYAEQNNKVPESVVTIDRTNLDRTGATDMASVVKYLPLVNAPKAVNGGGNAWDGSGTTGYNIRGVDANRVGLDVDGVELASATPEPDGAKGNSYSSGRDFIDPEMFSSISVVSGTTNPSSEGIGGRVTFKTKSPEDYLKNGKQVAGTLKSGFSSADSAWFTSATGAVGNDVVQGLVAYSHRDGHATESNGTLSTNPSDWTSDAILAKLLWNITENQKIGFTFDYYKKNAKNVISADLLSSLYPQGATQTINGERNRYALDYRFTPESFVLFDRLDANAYYQATKNNNRTYAYYSTGKGYRTIYNNYTEDNYGLSVNALKQLNNHKITYGLTANQMNSDRPWQQYNPDGSVTVQNRMVKSETSKYSLYVSDAMTWDIAGQPFTVTPGLRYQFERFNPKNASQVLSSTAKRDQVEKSSNDYYAPSLALDYQIASGYYTYAKYNRGARIATAAEMSGTYDPGRGYSIVGNSDLKKETSDAFELGLKTTPVDGIHFDVTGFYTKYKNFIDYKTLSTALTGDSTTYQLQNVANVNIWGGEVSFRADIGKFVEQADGVSLALVAGTTKGVSKNTSGVKGGVNSVQPEKASLTFAYDDPAQKYGLGFTTTAVASKKATKDSSVITSTGSYKNVPGYVVHDLTAYWNANKYMTFNVALNNIFDEKYWDYATVATLTNASAIDRATLPGRNVVASIEFKF
ncbi:TonB-dependent hemoglobin/transferrin/lactoferrin family receptor [Acinetobacter rathckeae]|uniref:TonB-dependent hemoglobin/transferrin/lactoferrin family receptor n=1 Tax=Acinetobacter rathckeae TaxID=2605272 RepID=UPI0018A30DFA|nr:TonB-dependent hemoglobin/transferrin/lactoferrin family receptor [Acinetobacter rathckeae]MBF7688543.1 TonB-dependent hemoglobin/transferrin/lactoferrin family receptor [Acinetobacter rathckeae]MBF7695790.1 TonB-dependent hemoglobin/transferrin/lactoferrin family receptor [Acinetobacter rathckeae]